MVRPPFDIVHELQRHGDALRQLAFDLVRDTNAADDAVQEVWLAALQRPPRHQDALSGWLATALHNVVRMWRRKQQRRDRYEAAASAGRDTIDHGEARSREELGHELLRAVESLEPAYRDVIWQRFFEGKPPRAIAAASGVPLATVKSRLQRGLGILRERLGQGASGRGGCFDWRREFAVAFGLRETTAAASAAALVTGGVLVATWAKMTALAAAAVAISAIWWWPLDEVVAPWPERVEHVAAVPATAEAGPAPNATPEGAAVAREAVPPPPPPPPTDVNAATLRGRCVDEAGLPVAGCTVTLGGSPRSSAQMDAWLDGHPALQWQDPTPVTTGADGAFAFTFVAPPPYHFWLAAESPGRAWIGGSWRSFEASKVIELGDVVMPPGIEVRGRVVDANGAPDPDAGWHLQREPRYDDADGVLNPTSSLAGWCLADGTFVASRRFAAGTYEVQASQGDRKSDAQRLVLAREQPVVDVTLQLKGQKQPAITGRVVDEQGQPVRSARILASAEVATTNRDGRFTLWRPMDEPNDTVSLRVTAEGFETNAIAAPIAWGTAGVDVVLHPRAALTLSVRDERDAPVIDYTVRCIPVRDTGHVGHSSDDGRIRARGPHADGVVTVSGVSNGTWRLVLEFAASSGLPPWTNDVEIPAAGMRLDVRLQELAHRWLRVVTRDGTPVAGTRVQVIDIPREGRERAVGWVMDTTMWLASSGGTHSRIAFEGVTDARGLCELRAQRDRTLGLRVLGPGHAPLAQDVSLDDASELVVEVAGGARLTGRITPPDALAQLLRYDLTDQTRPSWRPTLHLRPASGQPSFTTMTRAGEVDSPAVTVAADGSYACDGKPAGTWRVDVVYMRSTGASGASSDTVELARIDLHDGQETRLDIDLGWLLPAEIEATVTWNGARFANAKVQVESHHGDANGKPIASSSFEKTTDANGAFRMMVRPGSFFVTLKSAADGGSTAPLRCPVPVVVVAGRTTAHTFDFISGKLHVTLVDAAGKPAEGVIVYAGSIHDGLPATDASGSVIGEAVAGARLLRALPKAIAAKAAGQRQFLWYRDDDPFAGQWLELGTVTVLAGTTTEVALRLPPEWDRQ